METTEIERQVNDLVSLAGGYRAVDQGSLVKASELLLAAKELEDKVKNFFAPLKAKAHAAWKEICKAEDRELFKLKPVIDALSRSIASYKAEQERKRREAELERIRAEMEKKRLEEEALRRAQEAEARAKAAKDEESRRAAQAEADMILVLAADEEKKIAPTPTVPEAPKTEGLCLRIYWKARVIDLRALIQAILSEQVSIEAVSPNLPYLNDLAGKLKDQAKIPGVEIYSESKMAMTARRR